MRFSTTLGDIIIPDSPDNYTQLAPQMDLSPQMEVDEINKITPGWVKNMTHEQALNIVRGVFAYPTLGDDLYWERRHALERAGLLEVK